MVNSERSNKPVVLSAHEIAKSYGQLEALTDLTFELRAGEIIGLLGPNGAGKTTAIRVLTTILPASRGHFTVMDIADAQAEEIRALIGVMPESSGFPMGMIGIDFLTYMGQLYGRSKIQAKEKAAELLQLFGLENAGQALIATYSRGMKQRLGVARSLLNDPKILFLDEPTLGLDPKGLQEMLLVIQEAAEVKQVAVIICSHLLDVVEAICHRILMLNHGRVVAEGSVAEIKRRVAAPHTCRIQTTEAAVAEAAKVLSAITGVTVEHNIHQKGELIVSAPGMSDDENMNALLQHLLQAGIPIESFSRDSMRLSDAYLSMIEETNS